MSKTKEIRARGAKPHDPETRFLRVKTAVRDLERIGAVFSVADVAERAGVSRATIYRSQDLRDLIGAKGDGPRLVDAALHEKICSRHETQKAKVRALRRQLAELEASWDEMRERAKSAEQKLAAAERRIELQSAQMRGGVGGALDAVAARLGPEERRRARRILARALHPDLFAQDTATSTLATELLKTLNALAE
ncbi:MAG: hypothetical protein ACRYFS_18095 [Janthinobacterium lividum]